MTIRERFWRRVQRQQDDRCWLWTASVNSSGYGQIGTGSVAQGTYKNLRAHRFSWEIHNGPIPSGMMVLHRCDNRRCVNPKHLFLGDAADNFRDCVRKKRAKFHYGERNKNSKLTANKVREILRLAGHLPQRAIASRIGCHQGTVSQIISGKTWRKINDEHQR